VFDALTFSLCMRADGIPNSPEQNSQVTIGIASKKRSGQVSSNSDLNPNNPEVLGRAAGVPFDHGHREPVTRS
jgi:hypothetical protein